MAPHPTLHRALRRLPGLLLTVALVGLAGCGSETPPTAPGEPDPVTAPGTYVRTLDVDGTPRRYRVHLPETVDPAVPSPAVLVLHGFPPVDMAAVTALDRHAERLGFLAVYPESAYGEDWVQACACTPNGLRGVDDLAYVDAVLRDLASAVAVDPVRRFVAGFSNGGMMTYRLACDRPSAFAGFATVGAAVWEWHRERCAGGAAVPLLMIHGTEDPSFPWDGASIRLVTGGIVQQLPLEEHVSFWAGRNGCEPAWSETPLPDRTDDGTRAYVRSWASCDRPTRFVRVEGGGHTWPGMPVAFHPSLGRRSLDVDATAEIVDFFLGG